MTGYGDFIFQAMFAATAATIVSGAVAERIKLPSFMIFATLLVAIAYPVVGSWHWGGGWLSGLNPVEGEDPAGFKDFAGSAVVHAFGGFVIVSTVCSFRYLMLNLLENFNIRFKMSLFCVC